MNLCLSNLIFGKTEFNSHNSLTHTSRGGEKRHGVWHKVWQFVQNVDGPPAVRVCRRAGPCGYRAELAGVHQQGRVVQVHGDVSRFGSDHGSGQNVATPSEATESLLCVQHHQQVYADYQQAHAHLDGSFGSVCQRRTV